MGFKLGVCGLAECSKSGHARGCRGLESLFFGNFRIDAPVKFIPLKALWQGVIRIDPCVEEGIQNPVLIVDFSLAGSVKQAYRDG